VIGILFYNGSRTVLKGLIEYLNAKYSLLSGNLNEHHRHLKITAFPIAFFANVLDIRYKNMGRKIFRFVRLHAFDGQANSQNSTAIAC